MSVPGQPLTRVPAAPPSSESTHPSGALGAGCLARVLLWCLLAVGCRAQSPILRRPVSAIDGNSKDFFDRQRISALPAGERAAWENYLFTSGRLGEKDWASMAAELRVLGKTSMTKAPYRK